MKTKSFCILGLSFFLLTSCTDKQTKKEIKTHASASQVQSYINQIKTEREEALNRYVAALPLEQKIAQLFIENLEGCTSFRSYETVGAMTGEKDDRPLIAGGYIFFSYNIADTRDQMQTYIKSIRDYCDSNNNLQPYLCVDQEGGWVSRLKKLNPKLPSNEKVAQDFDIAATYQLYAEQADGMKTLGFDMNLAPVVEVCTDDNKDFLDGRSFGNLEQVTTYGRACLNAYENNGIATVLKHFPGNTNTDPHTGLPEITLPEPELQQSIESFRELVQYNPAAVLMSHARTSAIDSGVPACLSKVWVTDILRKEYGYEGLIFSDDIFMGALADNGYPPEEAAIRAVEAGVDCIMISEKRFAKAGKVLYNRAKEDAAFEAKIDQAVERIIKYKLETGLIDEQEIR
jgi:beta-N-acetylhexosaminidase